MGLRQRIISEVYDEKDNKIVDRKIIVDKEIKKPEKIEDLGYDHKEQINILQEIQDAFLFTQSTLIISNKCSTCGSRVIKSGYAPSDFHTVYTDHKLRISRLECCNKECTKRRMTPTIYSLFGSNMHPDLLEKQIKIAAEQSFMDSQKSLERENGRYRTINNQLTIKKNTEKIGKILNDIHQEEPVTTNIKFAKELIAQVDGGYVKSKEKNNRNFEVLISKVYKPEDHIPGDISKNGIRKSGTITDKIYSASALKDRGKTIKKMVVISAKKHGMTSDTNIVALSDGAANCWNALKVLEKHCKSIEYILDWQHIKRRFEPLVNKLEDPYAGEIESIQWKVWHGKSSEAIDRLGKIYIELLNTDCADETHDLLKYLSNNKHYLTNYEKRKQAKLVYTTSAIESSVETLVNTRHKKKHKAQWTRDGAHTLLQIRTSIASNKWQQEWIDVKNKFYKLAA
jgi:hypothetical protein